MLAWSLCIMLTVLVLVLGIKIRLIHISMAELTAAIEEHLSSDTNRQLFLSSGDRSLRRFALRLSEQLKRLKEQRQRYTQGDRELKEAVTNISHDLRTPLTAIYGYLDLLEGEPKSPQAARYLAEITERTGAMRELTEELFRYSIVSSVSELQCVNTDIRKVLEDTLISFYGVIREHRLEPVISLPDSPVERTLDPSALARVFGNIISNAVKYSEGALEVTMDERGTVVFSNPASALTAVDVAKLFDRFYTVDPSRTSTGLGLSIAKVLTERMGGAIHAAHHDKILRITVQF